MKELERVVFMKMLSDGMTPFKLKDEALNESLEQNALKLCLLKMMEEPKPKLEICYANDESKLAFYFFGYGEEKKFLVMVSDDKTSAWVGYYFLDLNTEFGPKSQK